MNWKNIMNVANQNGMLSQEERDNAFRDLCEQAEKLGYRITDWVSTEMLVEHYGVTEEQAFEVIAAIDIGDYDAMCINANAGSSDGRREVLDNAVRDCGYLDDDDEDDEDDEDQEV